MSVTCPEGKARPKVGALQTWAFFPRPWLLPGLGRLLARGAATLDAVLCRHAAPPLSLTPFPSPAGTQERQPPGSAPRSQEVRGRAWACLGTCCLFAGPRGCREPVW